MPRQYKQAPSSLEAVIVAPLMAVLNVVEDEPATMTLDEACALLPGLGESPREVGGNRISPVHPGLMAWTRTAAENYLAALSNDPGLVGATGLSATASWVRQYPAADGTARPFELCVWGRPYAYSRGGRIFRELRVPVVKRAEDKRLSDEEIAVMAYVLATGAEIDRLRFTASRGSYLAGEIFPLLPPDSRYPSTLPPDRVRIVKVGSADGRTETVFDEPRSVAERLFVELGSPALRNILSDDSRRPGRDCYECKIRPSCRALHRRPGVLGVEQPLAWRSWSVTVGRYHADCPAKAHFRQVGLPSHDAQENPKAVRQGKAVHDWLRRMHERTPVRPCTEDDLPDDPNTWASERWDLAAIDSRNAWDMLRMHLEVCPLTGLGADDKARPEQRLVIEDRRANVLIVADADLLYRRNGSWCYREVKTTTKVGRSGGEQLLTRYPQLALAVLLFEFGEIPLGPSSLIELEVLRSDEPDIRLLDPRSARIRAAAREVIAGLVGPWHSDTEYTPTPSEKVCRSCGYQRWCSVAETEAPRV
ncbi:PD-(D/E)XK nuclease family protein [Actinocorallia sp. A-T 12471]|uniref:PD-(D/E)XK nuclease family protein n=1 Tax=Actinocorallia sp. A-T 12471 TaxID=3089813 RepID=UPI0029CCA002|nr:PD-(D/E)XK nuclease family protein [Actinocorallia sp. A-T 12471]MDX6738456.1 PD-(D/E)XK nuclease family protein [Actinocorallia sp. A-T 12471]